MAGDTQKWEGEGLLGNAYQTAGDALAPIVYV